MFLARSKPPEYDFISLVNHSTCLRKARPILAGSRLMKHTLPEWKRKKHAQFQRPVSIRDSNLYLRLRDQTEWNVAFCSVSLRPHWFFMIHRWDNFTVSLKVIRFLRLWFLYFTLHLVLHLVLGRKSFFFLKSMKSIMSSTPPGLGSGQNKSS